MRTLILALSLLLVLVGLAPVVHAQDTWTVTGTVTRITRENHGVHIRPDTGGPEQSINVKDLPDATEKGIKVGDHITATVKKDPGRPNPKWSRAVSLAAAGSSASSSSDSWQRIHGVVRNVQGSTLTLKADDGRRLTVDMSKVGPEIQGNLKPGDRVTVAAHEFNGNQVRAEFIQKQSSAGVQPSASPSPDDKNWQRIHGTVQSVSGRNLTLKADDGRTLTVDMKDVSQAVRKALTPGEGVTVAGFYKGDDKNVSARFIQQDSSAKK